MENEKNWSEQNLEELKLVWIEKQNHLRCQVITEDTESWQKTLSSGESPPFALLKHVAGLDISFIKGDLVNAYVALVVLSFPDLQTVYEDCQPVMLTQPYIPGFLAFREIDHCTMILDKLKKSRPEVYPQVIFIDGNGLLHPRECGIACQLGVEIGCVTIGCAKNLYQMDSLSRNEKHKDQIDSLLKAGDFFELKREESETKVLGAALKTVEKSSKPIYVSVGHKISLPTACSLVTKCSIYREPEPIRRADHLSRDLIRKMTSEVENELPRCSQKAVHDNEPVDSLVQTMKTSQI